MLVECGFIRATDGEGREWSFTPSLGRIARLGTPREIVELFAALHTADDPTPTALYILAALCDQDEPADLIGYLDEDRRHVPGLMPAAEMLLIARHLMQHGCVGESKPDGQGRSAGAYAADFKASEFIAAARVHLGLSSADAEALSMTELHQMLAMKFPDREGDGTRHRDVPTRAEYDAAMARLKERRGG